MYDILFPFFFLFHFFLILKPHLHLTIGKEQYTYKKYESEVVEKILSFCTPSIWLNEITIDLSSYTNDTLRWKRGRRKTVMKSSPQSALMHPLDKNNHEQQRTHCEYVCLSIITSFFLFSVGLFPISRTLPSTTY